MTAAPEELFRDLFRHAPAGYLTTTDDGVVELVNDTFLRWTGLSRDAVVGTRLVAHLPVGDQILFATHCLPRLAMDGAVDEVAVEFLAADGSRRAALLSAVRVPATADRPATVRVVVFGAHERRRFERDLLASRTRAEESEARRAVVEAELQHRVLHDPLTGLRNRAGLLADLGALLGQAGPGRPVVVVFLDLDRFKEVNDSLGHAAGDDLLVEVTRRLRGATAPGSSLARLAGDEFVVAGRLDRAEAGGDVARRLLRALAPPVVLHGIELVVPASAGVVVTTSPDDTAEDLVRRADLAMYRAKAAGPGGSGRKAT